MDLYEYFCRQRILDKNFRERLFAEQLGIDPCYLSSIKMQKVKPGIKLALKIEEATNGQIKALDLVKEKVVDVQRSAESLDSKRRKKARASSKT